MNSYLVDVTSVLENKDIKEINSQVELDTLLIKGTEVRSKPLRINLKAVSIPEKSVRVEGKIAGVLILPCHRCLNNFEHPLKLRINQLFSVKPSNEEVLPIEKSNIELFTVIEQALILNLPIKLICHNDCKGLCPKCGKNLNLEPCTCEDKPIDIRWQKLGEYFKGRH